MPYLHGVYTSESPTSVVPSVNAASCLPFVIGTAPADYEGDTLVRCRTWQEFKSNFGAAESYTGADPSTLCAFARQWFKRAGASDALFYALGGASESSDAPIQELEGCTLASSDTSEMVVYDSDGHVVTPVEGATYYVSETCPDAAFWVENVTIDSVPVTAVVTNDAYDALSGTFSLKAYSASQTVGTISDCQCGSVTEYGCVILDSEGSPVAPIEGAMNYARVTLNGRKYPVLRLDADAIEEGSPECLVLVGTHGEYGPTDTFDVVGLAPSSGGSGASVTDALAALDTVYERFGLVVTVVLCPRTGIDSASEIAAKVQKFGSGWSAIALIDIPYTWADGTPTLPLKSSYLVYCSPRCQAGDEIVDASCVVAGAMAATDASAGGFPYVSPSNKLAYIDGIVDESGDPLFQSQPDVNDLFNANAVVSFLHNAKGWVVWGNNTGYYSPSATDPKDRWISVRRTFC